jgi:hypothetical protein
MLKVGSAWSWFSIEKQVDLHNHSVIITTIWYNKEKNCGYSKPWNICECFNFCDFTFCCHILGLFPIFYTFRATQIMQGWVGVISVCILFEWVKNVFNYSTSLLRIFASNNHIKDTKNLWFAFFSIFYGAVQTFQPYYTNEWARIDFLTWFDFLCMSVTVCTQVFHEC